MAVLVEAIQQQAMKQSTGTTVSAVLGQLTEFEKLQRWF